MKVLSKYYATGKDNYRCRTPIRIKRAGLFIECNPNIKQYRINGMKGVPVELMGYNPHYYALIDRCIKFLRKAK